MNVMSKNNFIQGYLDKKAPQPSDSESMQRIIDQALRNAAKASKCWDRHVGALVVSLSLADWAEERGVVERACNVACEQPKCHKFNGKACTAMHAEVAVLKDYANLWNNGDGDAPRPQDVALIVSYPPCEACLKRAEADGINTVVYWELEPQISMIDALARVREYHERLGYPALPCNTEDKYRQAREVMLAMSQEVAELTDSMQWKPWRAARNYAHHNMLEESADILFFMDSLFMLFGISWAELAQAIADKVEVTDNRIKEGYHS